MANKSNLMTVRASFHQEHRNSELEGKMQLDIKVQVSYVLKQSILGNSTTILHLLTEVKGRKIF